MKRLLLIILATLCSLASTAQWYAGEAHIMPFRFEQLGDSLYIAFNCDVNELKVKPNRTVAFTPMIVSSDKRVKLPSILIKGRTEYLITGRLEALGESRKSDTIDAYTIAKGFGRHRDDLVGYSLTVPYEGWMHDSRLYFIESVEGCGGKAHTISSYEMLDRVKLEPPIVPYIIEPKLAYIQPRVEAIKRRELMAEAYLDFRVNSIDIDPEYGNNPVELNKITAMFNSVATDPDVTVRNIAVIGYASPEGGYSLNERLSQGRANTLVYYLLPRFNFNKSLYHVEFGGENWVGLVEKVKASRMEYRYDVLELLENLPDKVDAQYSAMLKQKLIKVEWGLTYKYMLRNIFPSLRKAICKVEYDIKSFDVDQAKQIIKVRPQNLSLNEMYHVASTYQVGSDEFINVFETAVRIFPNDATANLNAAIANLSRGDADRAVKYLVRANDDSPQYNNAMGVLCMLNGEYKNAEEFLLRAQKANMIEATHNLEQLRKKLENIALIESKKHK